MPAPLDPNTKIMFATTEIDGTPGLILGVPKGAWEYMKDGKTHTFDLTKAGLNLKLIIFGGPTHDECISMINMAGAQDMRRSTDFSIKPKDDQ